MYPILTGDALTGGLQTIFWFFTAITAVWTSLVALRT